MNKKGDMIDRRAFLARGTLFIVGTSVLSRTTFAESEPTLRIALLTDVHYADKATQGNRHYRESPEKLGVAAGESAKYPIDFAVELGDFIDGVEDAEADKKYLRTINAAFAKISEHRHYVLGNHCVDFLTKKEFLEEVGQEKSYYSFDRNGWHFMILDACFRKDGIPYGRKNADWRDTLIPDPA